MAKHRLTSLIYILFLSIFLLCCHSQEDNERKIHVVYMGALPKEGVSVASLHHSMLEDVLGRLELQLLYHEKCKVLSNGSSDAVKASLVYSYGRSFNGFAAKLSPEEVNRFSEMNQVVSVLPNTIFKPHTTRSWDFMGFSQNQVIRAPTEGDVVVGFLDTGAWPESKSFNDEGFGPPPAKWKGICQNENNNFTCNNKLIGARYYNSMGLYDTVDFQSPRDSEGHGTHTASTAAGREVTGASFCGLAEGVARGAVPNARIAIYKVCWSWGCNIADIIAAYDDAIADGVDVLSTSIGPIFALPYSDDPLAIGAFHAMKKGIVTVNSGGDLGQVTSVAPWSLTVAASTIDRKFVSQVVLGNGDIISGNAINAFTLNATQLPLIYGGNAPNISAGFQNITSLYCLPGFLNAELVHGKIVLCDYHWDGSGVLLAGGLGTIMYSDNSFDHSYSYPLPATHIGKDDRAKILDYIQSSKNPIATILVGKTCKDFAAPYVASFSARGPNKISSDILKPDLTAPGADILAAWSPVVPPSRYPLDERQAEYFVMSGTSMSCPHVSGAAAYVKSIRPAWSSAAIQSALMTTATVMDPRKNEDAEFAYGSGHLNPLQAVNPGLVYNATEQDYVDFLCAEGYTANTLKLITGNETTNCSTNATGKAWDLNYPSFALSILDGQPIQGTFPRRVTNVGSSNSTYYASVHAPSSLNITVEPSILSFTTVGEEKSFTVSVQGGVISQQPIISASIVWSDGLYNVRSPLVVYTIFPIEPTWSFSARHDLGRYSLYHKNGILKGY